MKAKAMITLLGASLLIAATGCNKKGTDAMNNADKEFLERAAYYNKGMIDGGNIAISRGSEAVVTAYAQTMVAEHTAALNELKQLASDRDYNLPGNSDLEHQAVHISLKDKSGRNFDSSYMKLQLFDHMTAADDIYTDEINKGNDDALKNYAAKYKPKAASHRDMAQTIVTSMNY